MEQKMGKFVMGQQNNSEQISYNSVDNSNQGMGSVTQRFIQDPSNSMSINSRPSDHNMTVGARPVLNYSIQTGEEFALEFMWERVNPRQYIPNSPVEANSDTTSVNLHGVLGASHTGSERYPDAYSFPSVEKGKVQDLVSNVSLRDEKPIDKSLPSATRTSSKISSIHRFQSHSSMGSFGGSLKMLKLLCSFGGKVLPRPSDQKLRYAGGETRILRISQDISWEELKQKAMMMYSEPHSIKYQLPGEDLDALVTVSSDEDLQNMMEECNLLDVGESQKLRLFLIPNNDLEDSQLGLENVEGDSEVQYVVAVNSMDFGSRRNSVVVKSHFGNNLDELLSLRVESETGRIPVAVAAGGTLNARVVSPSPNQSSQTALPSPSHAFEASSLGYQVQTINHQQHGWHSSQAFHQMDTLPNVYQKTIVPPSDRIQYGYGSLQSTHAQIAEKMVPDPVLGQPYGSLNAEVAKVSGLETKLDQVESDKDHSPVTDVPRTDTQMNMENSIKKISDHTIVQSLDDGKTDSLQTYDTSSLTIAPSEEAFTVTSAATHKGTLVIPKISEKNHEDARDCVPPIVVQDQMMNKFDIDNHSHTSGASVHGDSLVYAQDISYEPDILPHRMFQSERILREQSGLNRLFKSDDSIGPQLLMAHSKSDVSQKIAETADKLTGWNVTDDLDRASTEGNVKEPQNFADDENDFSAMTSRKNQSNLKAELNVGSNFPLTKQGTSEFSQYESAPASTETRQKELLEKANEEELHVTSKEDIPSTSASESKHHLAAGTPEHGDILIDINDRFPHDLLSDIFSKAITEESSAGFPQLHGDAAGLSVNMTNHEPKHWSFFQNLAKDDHRKDVSLMDQDHLAFSSSQAKIGEDASMDYGYLPFETGATAADGVDSSSNFGAKNPRQSSGPVGPDIMNLPSDYDISQAPGVQSLQLDRPMTSRTVGSDYEDGKKATQQTGFPLVDLFDPSTLQIIKNRDLEELRELGSGTYGTVYHGKWRGSDVAIKRIKKSCFVGRSSEQERLSADFWHEAEILSKLHHPNVVAFYGVVQDGPGGTLATVTEYMVNGSLRHVLISKDRYRHLDRRKRLIIAMDAAFGMEYLHSRNIVHFDLKCDNLLVNLKDPSRPICKVGDFGLSKIKRNTLVTGGVRGTLPWMAPELLNGSSSMVSEKVDVFSFGIVLWEILTGEEPYANMHYGAIIGGIVNNTLRPPVPSFCDPEWRLLMEQCWAPDSLARPSFTEIAARLRSMSAVSFTKPQVFTPLNHLPPK
ncbi:hypothetical protein ABFS82_13G191000 [Erythranthe guttata]|uniref:Protein kinase domain-containing protein n=1 Tax=Erythranthe guttata TaxID=4155 RepID=A0A022RT11_ERYGU|nr:PREDICTED: uncharacterized protein LOC105950894 isoform X1 [Erythranthe guttata]EYU43662.1 hypothetical protein MIMGU_mgv1a000322mg [Erythranthe guttata]|eukprot:XP_012829722.1 PREDICTED: uncharacterized protein LOC105950894 isoform X1 [Erythranthe guttata]